MNRLSILPVLLLVALSLLGCNKDKIEQLEREKAALQAEKARQDSVLNDFMNTFNEFEDNINMIKEKESLITMGADNPEYRTDGKEAIIEDIQMINDLLDQNRQIIEELSAKAERAEGLSAEYRRTIGSLKRQLEERDTEIGELKEQLVALDYRIEDLNGRIDNLSQENQQLTRTTQSQGTRIQRQQDSLNALDRTLYQQDRALNTAYYITGTSRELKDLAVVDRNGLFGGKEVSEDFDASAFSRIDIREVTEIPVATRRADILTNHPSGSYEFKDLDGDRKYDVLQITNPDEFWKTSKYLVVG